MGVLGNTTHERFCQAVHRRVLAGEPRGVARTAAYRETVYKGDNPDDRVIAPDARRLANQKAIKGRIQELADYAAKLAGIDASWAMVQLAARVRDFNIEDYLTPAGAGERFFNIAGCTREELGKLSELSMEEDIIEAGEETMRKVRKIKIKPYDPASIIGLMARIAGWEAPKKIAQTDPSGTSSAPMLVEIVRFSDAKNPTPA